MRSIVVASSCYGSSASEFQNMLNKALIGLENKNCITHSIKYSIAAQGSTIIYSAVILYDIVPTRTVIVEKVEKLK